MTVSLRQLEYFVAVVDEGSFTAAAQKLRVTQPGLSHQVQSLERELGGPLLERLPRTVRPTPAGRAALPHARACLAHAERATGAARRASGVMTGELQVATLFSISVGILPRALRAWQRDHPGLRVQLVEFRHTDDLRAAMEAGQADLAVGPVPQDWAGPVQEIGAEEFIIAGAPDSGLPAQSSRVPVADLSDHLWVHFTPDSGLSQILDRTCAAAGFQPRIAIRTEQSASALNYAQAGIGLTLVPGNVIPPRFEGIILRPEPPVLRPLGVYTRDNPDPVSAAFATAISDQTLVNPPHIARLGATP
jgi:DNA-binding transcriptional LysR family regulator